MATIEELADRVERLLLRHEELQRTNALLTTQLGAVTSERDNLRSRLNAARSRIDVLLAGSDGRRDNALIIELKAWDKAGLSEIENMVVSPIGGSTLKQHSDLQAVRIRA